MCFAFSVPIFSLFFYATQSTFPPSHSWYRCVVGLVWSLHCVFAPISGTRKGWRKAGPSSALLPLRVFSPVGALQSDCRRRPSRATVPKDGRWELQLLGPGPRNEHRCLDSRGGDIDPTFPGRSVKEVAAVCNPPGASLSSSKTEDTILQLF